MKTAYYCILFVG